MARAAAVWVGCACQSLGFIEDRCLAGMFPPFLPMPWCSLSIEKLVGPVPEAQRVERQYPCINQCGKLVARPKTLCRSCKKKEKAVQLCLL